MTEYVSESISKEGVADSAASEILTRETERDPSAELRHGEWIESARKTLVHRRFGNPLFGLLIVFLVLYGGSVYLFENMIMLTKSLYALKIAISGLFAVSLGFILSIWWGATTRFDEKLREAERIDREYRELLMSFSDSLFDIINALNTLAAKPPRAFVIATEFLLGEYVHTLQSCLQRYGDYVAGLGFDATDFLDEKIRIFEGIRERAGLSIRGMPKEIESLFIADLNLDIQKLVSPAAQRQMKLREKLSELTSPEASASDAA